MNGRRWVLAGTVAAVLGLGGGGPLAQAETVSVVASGIDNPRHVALGPDGAVYVASAGKGGSQCRGKGEDRSCLGTTSRVLKLAGGAKSVVASGFPSIAGDDGSFAVGVDGVGVRPDGRVLGLTFSGTPDDAETVPAPVRRVIGRLFDVTGGEKDVLADVGAFEWDNNPDKVKGDRNSNPYALLALADRTIVVDAGGNSVLEVGADGTVKLLAVIPKNGKNQAVPSSIALGPDGSYYVGELAEGAGRNKARVWKIPAGGGTPTVHASGFTTITGVAFGPDGSLFVTELMVDPRKEDFVGDVVRLRPDGSKQRLGTGKLLAPQGAAVDASGAVYVSNYSVAPATTSKKSPFKGKGGQVVKITP